MHNNPIGIFDSGVGGITILNSIKEIMPNEDIILRIYKIKKDFSSAVSYTNLFLSFLDLKTQIQTTLIGKSLD